MLLKKETTRFCNQEQSKFRILPIEIERWGLRTEKDWLFGIQISNYVVWWMNWFNKFKIINARIFNLLDNYSIIFLSDMHTTLLFRFGATSFPSEVTVFHQLNLVTWIWTSLQTGSKYLSNSPYFFSSSHFFLHFPLIQTYNIYLPSILFTSKLW